MLRFVLVMMSFTAFSLNLVQAQESPFGKRVADFKLPDVVTGKEVRLSASQGQIRVAIFYSHTCTFCRQYEDRFRKLASDRAGKGVIFVAIDSTERCPETSATAWKDKKMSFPLLRDERALVAAALGATALTTVAIIDADGALRYVGAFDDCESGDDIRHRFVADAVDALLAGKSIPHPQTEVYGCMIPLPR